jgi:hypothetical protein
MLYSALVLSHSTLPFFVPIPLESTPSDFRPNSPMTPSSLRWPFSLLSTVPPFPDSAVVINAIDHGIYDESLTINDAVLQLLRHIVDGECYHSPLSTCISVSSQWADCDVYSGRLFDFLHSNSVSYEVLKLVCSALGVVP